jgi:hypothetical protein
MFAYPQSTAFGKAVPKVAIYRKARPTSRVKGFFVSQVQEIVWAYKLSPETINLRARDGYHEIQIFDVRLKGGEVDGTVLAAIDRAIPYPIIFRIHADAQFKLNAAYKRPAADGSKKWVTEARFETDWIPSDTPSQPLPVALDIRALYEQMLVPVVGQRPRKGESMPRMIQRIEQIRQNERDLAALRSRIRKERQFNRKTEINAQIRENEAELSALR